MTEYKPTEYVVDFGDCRSNQFVRLNMALIEHNGAKLHERIVRCRDCEYIWHRPDWQPDKRFAPMDMWICEAEWCTGFEGDHPAVTPDGFCAWAKRKEVER